MDDLVLELPRTSYCVPEGWTYWIWGGRWSQVGHVEPLSSALQVLTSSPP